MRADAGLHANSTRRQIGESGLHLAARPFLQQHDGTAPILANDVERVLADIDADYGGRSVDCDMGVLLVFGAPCQHSLLAGRKHGRTSQAHSARFPIPTKTHREVLAPMDRAEEKAEPKDVGEQALMRGLDTAFPFFRLGLSLV